MGGPYNIPRDYKGESKILFIFFRNSFIYTAVGGFTGVILFYLFKDNVRKNFLFLFFYFFNYSYHLFISKINFYFN